MTTPPIWTESDWRNRKRAYFQKKARVGRLRNLAKAHAPGKSLRWILHRVDGSAKMCKAAAKPLGARGEKSD